MAPGLGWLFCCLPPVLYLGWPSLFVCAGGWFERSWRCGGLRKTSPSSLVCPFRCSDESASIPLNLWGWRLPLGGLYRPWFRILSGIGEAMVFAVFSNQLRPFASSHHIASASSGRVGRLRKDGACKLEKEGQYSLENVIVNNFSELLRLCLWEDGGNCHWAASA